MGYKKRNHQINSINSNNLNVINFNNLALIKFYLIKKILIIKKRLLT